MDFEQAWNEALKSTEIIRSRIKPLYSGQDTTVPYIFLAESSVNLGDTVVRQGEVVVQKPALILPPNNAQLEGFELDDGQNDLDSNAFMNFLIVRGIQIPSMRYDNRVHQMDIFEGRLSQAVEHYKNLLQRDENTSTGLMIGNEAFWQFSLLIFVCSQITKNLDSDIKKLLDEFRGPH